jgi:hypothetical protein
MGEVLARCSGAAGRGNGMCCLFLVPRDCGRQCFALESHGLVPMPLGARPCDLVYIGS